MKKYTVQDIAEEISQEIIQLQLPRDTKIDSPAVLAERYQVSEKSIHRALNTLKAKGLIYRIHGSGSYVKSNIQPHSRFRIGVFLYHLIGNENATLNFIAYDHFTEQLKKELTELGHSVEIFTSSFDSQKAQEVLQNELLLSRFDVLIVAAGFRGHVENILRNCRMPVILFNDDIYTPGPWHQVFYDYTAGFERAIRYLMSQHIRELYVLGVASREVSERRYQAVLKAAELCQFAPEHIHKIFCHEAELEMLVLTGQACGKKYLALQHKFDGILSLSDYLTVGFETIMKEQKLRRDCDYFLVSYDNFATQLQQEYRMLDFSAITHPQSLMCTELVHLVEELRRYPDFKCYHASVIPATELVIRANVVNE